MIDELCDVIRRETDAATALEGRLRALELVVAADEQRFVALALDEMEVAAERLAALELTRVLMLSTAGIAVDVSARDLVAVLADPDAGESMSQMVTELALATERLGDARLRAEVVVANGSQRSRDRLDAANSAIH